MRRIPALVLVLGCLAAACSSAPAEVEVGGGDPPVEPPAGVPEREVDDPEPGTEPPVVDIDETLPLDPTSALLTATDVRGPWDEPSTSNSPGWDIGPNQTDCEVYWELESAAGHPFAHRLWFQPGANLNHEVYDTGPEAADRLMDAAARLADECPNLSWGEGGLNSISALPVDVEGVVAFEMFDQSGEIIWQAYAGRANLVSRLWRVHFEPGTQPSGDAFAEFERLAAVMVRRLGGATTGPAPTTTIAPATTSLPPASTSTTSTSTTTTEPAGDELDDHPLAGLLLTGPELPGGLAVDETLPSIPTSPEDQLIDGCDASQAAVTLDSWFELQRSFLGDRGLELLQIVGLAPSAQDAADAVEEFGRIGQCTPPDDIAFGDFTFAGGPLDGIDGATAVWIEMESELLSVRFVAYHRNEVVGVVILSETGSSQLASMDLHRGLAQAAVDLAEA